MRLAGLLGLSSGDESDRVRALVAKVALDRGDGGAACDILSAAILRRPPRPSGGAGGRDEQGGAEEAAGALPFAPELCEALDLVVEWGSGSGSASQGTGTAHAPARTADLCAQALSRCPASQIGRLLGPWSRFEAVRYLAGTAASGGGGGGGSGGGGTSAASGGGGGTAAVASALAEGGMDEHAATSLGRALAADFDLDGGERDKVDGDGDGTRQSSWLDRLLAGGRDGEGALGVGVEGPVRAAEGALRFLLLRENGLSSPSSSPASVPGSVAAGAMGQASGGMTTKPLGYAEPPERAAAAVVAAADGGETDDVLQKATDRLCILLALAELRSSEEDEPRAVLGHGPSADDRGGCGAVVRTEGESGATAAETKASEHASGRIGREGAGVATAVAAAAAAGGPTMLARLARGVAEEFGVGAVERGVGYALAASDGRSVLCALRALLEEAEGRVKVLRDAVVEQGGQGLPPPAVGQPGGEDDEVKKSGHEG